MAAFGISYKGLTTGDIRHIYSYNTGLPSSLPLATSAGQLSSFPPPLPNLYPPRFFDYYPAFREVEKIVERLRKPITCQIPQRRNHGDDHSRSRKAKVVRFKSPADNAKDDVETTDHDQPEQPHGTASDVKVKTPKDGKQQEVKTESGRLPPASDHQKTKKDKKKHKEKEKEKPKSVAAEPEQKVTKRTTQRHQRTSEAPLKLPPIHN
nr:hypothetical protein BaRGS_013217 [Batillaria attramentaria]